MDALPEQPEQPEQAEQACQPVDQRPGDEARSRLPGSVLELSEHARTRLQQRGMREEDIFLILDYGTRGPEGVVLRERDVEAHKRRLKRLIGRLERLCGAGVVVSGRTVVTVMWPDREKRRQMLGKKAHRRFRRPRRVGRV